MRALIARPSALLAALTGCILLFALGRITGDRDPGAGDLAGAFSPTPLDSFGDLTLLDDSLFSWRAPLLLAARVVLVAVVLATLLQVRLTNRTFVRLGLVYLGAVVSVAIPLSLSVAFLRLFVGADTTLESIGIITTLVFLPMVMTGLVVVWAPITALAVANQRLRFILKRRAVWVLGGVSSWLYLFTGHRIEALEESAPNTVGPFLWALAVIVIQCVIFGAIAFAAIEQPVMLPDGSAARETT